MLEVLKRETVSAMRKAGFKREEKIEMQREKETEKESGGGKSTQGKSWNGQGMKLGWGDVKINRPE